MLKNRDFIIELLKCVRCGKCRAVCPHIEISDFSEIGSPRGRMRLAYGLITEKIPPTQLLIDNIYSCFYCGICQKTCPSGVEVADLVLKVRQRLIELGVAPQNINNLIKIILDSKNIYGLDQEDRLEWAFDIEDLIEDKIRIEADIGIFIGCSASYKGTLSSQPESIINILDTLDIKFTLLGEDEMCCGNPYFLGGGEINDEIMEIVKNNVEKFAELHIKELITACPGCYRVIHTIYPILLGKELPFKVLHVSQYFANLIKNKRLIIRNSINQKLTYQDPCELARHCGIYDEPRYIINNVPGLELVELEPNKEDALCCGGGGLVKALYPELVDEHLKIKFEQINRCNGIDGIITTCPSCQDNLMYGCNLYNNKLKVIDLCELLWNSISE